MSDNIEEADNFLKNQVYSDPSLAFNSQNKLIASSTGNKRNAVVTLTFAQSFDAKIAGKNGKQIQLSGAESSVMTHRLRAMHTHIMVGIGTLLNDNPQLNCRLPELLPLDQQPIPCILDSQLRTPLDCKLIKNAKSGIGHYPIILARPVRIDEAFQKRRDALRAVGCESLVDERNSGSGDILTLEEIVNGLKLGSNHSLMIEGGAGVISSVLSSSSLGNGADNLDRVIVTIAPTFVGEDGVAVNLGNTGSSSSLQPLATKSFGRDVVIAYCINESK